jgi:Zn-dependent M28 family amino/carboxypeptidase
MNRFAMVAMPILVILTGCGGGGDVSAPSGLPADAETAAEVITASALLETVTQIASDEMMGRGPGTEGDRLARKYLAQRLEAAGYAPAFGEHGYEQPMSMIGVTTELPEKWTFRNGKGRKISIERAGEFIGGSGVQQPAAVVDNAELVFVGYGITAPEENWDDFKGADLEGKMLVMLNDDPDWDPELFAGERRLYYGRWKYKYEIAAEKGAAGAIIIHTSLSAGYPWAVVLTGWSGEQFELPAVDEPRIQLKAWMTEEASRRLVEFAGHNLDELIESARSRDFAPVPLGLSTSLDLAVELRETETANVGGILRGSDPDLADEVVFLSAHHDYFGIGAPDETGDTIYNGALDNGVAMAQAISVAEAFSALSEPPRRSIMVFFPAAEEQGLLGSKYYTEHPTMAPGKMAADINFELGNIWGRTTDVTIFGKGKSTLEDVLADLAAEQGRYVTSESTPRSGWYYRSDQLSFASIGVPAIWFKSGTDFIDRPDGWGVQQHAEWIDRNYHRPSDQVENSWVLDGLVEDTHLGFRLALTVATADEMPTWYPGDEFEDERLAALAE